MRALGLPNTFFYFLFERRRITLSTSSSSISSYTDETTRYFSLSLPSYDIVIFTEIFLAQPCLLELEAPLKVCGDVHGQYSDLLRLFEYGGFPPEANYLFLGDYVDRGKQGLEVICLLLAYKVKYPENFFLLRGNHECKSINRTYGFYDSCKRVYSIKLWHQFT